MPLLGSNEVNIVYAIRLTHDPSYEYRYVGLTSRGINRLKEHLEDARSCKSVNYGADKSVWIREHYFNVSFDVLSVCKSADDLEFYERMWIHIFKEKGYRLFNRTSGGQGGPMSPETKEKLSRANKGKRLSQETKDKLSKWWKENGPTGEDHPSYGRVTSDDTKLKQSEAKKGGKHWAFGTGGETHYNYGRNHTEETKQKLSEAITGMKRSAETRAKMSAATSGSKNPHYGKPAHNRGVPMSQEQKDLISAVNKGKTNVGHHTRWHTNRGISNPDCRFCTQG